MIHDYSYLQLIADPLIPNIYIQILQTGVYIFP